MANKAAKTRIRDDALRDLAERRTRALREGQIDDSRLSAGSPMHIYCGLCGLLAETKPEDFTDAPKQAGDCCQADVDIGLLDLSDDRMIQEVSKRDTPTGSKEFLPAGADVE